MKQLHPLIVGIISKATSIDDHPYLAQSRYILDYEVDVKRR